MFYGYFRPNEDPQNFLTHFETFLATIPELTESEKCDRFYLHCHSGWDAEEWYENFENSSPEIIASWSTLRKHFHVKWLDANPNILLETSATVDAATTISRETITSTTTTTATDSNNSTTTIEQHNNEESTAGGGKEEAKAVEKQDGKGKQEADTGEREMTTTTQSEPVRFDWAEEVDRALGEAVL